MFEKKGNNIVKIYLLTIEDFKSDEIDKIKDASSFLKQKYIGKYTVDEFNKPISDTIFFNISHSGNFVVLATSKLKNIGVDIELIRPINDKLKQYILNNEEEINSDIDFFKIYTKKEAVLKCCGKGIDRRLDQIDTSNNIIELDNKQYRCLTMVKDEYVLSIALDGVEEFDIEQIIINKNPRI